MVAQFIAINSASANSGNAGDISVEATLAQATGAALQTDLIRAVDILEHSASATAGPVIELRNCMSAKLGVAEQAIQDGRGLENILAQYRRYWSKAFGEPSNREAASKQLLAGLAKSLGVAASWPEVENEIRRVAEIEGGHVLLGMTGPLRELMIWSRQELKSEMVPLPEGSHLAEVRYLDGFSSLGWADWATCGRRGTGGWATSTALFAVVPRYASIDSEEFRVTFLGHEAQHFADLIRYAGIPSWRLEYRGKLVELIGADVTRGRILRKFTEDQSDDPALPHSYANQLVLREMRKRVGASPANLAGVDPVKFRAAALELLREDSARLTTGNDH